MKNIMFELAKAFDLVCGHYQQDFLYDWDIMLNASIEDEYLVCINKCGSHTCKLDWKEMLVNKTYFGERTNTLLRFPPAIFKDDNFSGSAKMMCWVRVEEKRGGAVDKELPLGKVVWLSHIQIAKLRQGMSLEDACQYDIMELQ